jgi:hypothetical protein
MDALERFKKEFRGWIRALNEAKGFKASPDEVLERLEERIPESMLRQIGGAFINGWLQNEAETDRGYFVRESDRKGPRGGQWMLEHVGEGRISPCWELYVQLADYSRIRTVAERHGLTTRLEDRLMDITVYAGKTLVLYVENKAKKQQAHHLFIKMREYGELGFDIDAPDKGNDPLRKAKYLVREGAYPKYFALSAVDFEQMFLVEYHDKKNRFTLHKCDLSLTEPLLDAIIEGEIVPPSPVDPLALELEHLIGDKIWVSPGSGKTDYNFYFPSDKGDAIFMGVYEDGRIWSDFRTLGEEISNRLARELSFLGVTLDTSKEWQFWRKNDQMLNLHNEDPRGIAYKIVTALLPGTVEDIFIDES